MHKLPAYKNNCSIHIVKIIECFTNVKVTIRVLHKRSELSISISIYFYISVTNPYH